MELKAGLLLGVKDRIGIAGGPEGHTKATILNNCSQIQQSH